MPTPWLAATSERVTNRGGASLPARAAHRHEGLPQAVQPLPHVRAAPQRHQRRVRRVHHPRVRLEVAVDGLRRRPRRLGLLQRPELPQELVDRVQVVLGGRRAALGLRLGGEGRGVGSENAPWKER